jgi:hypothetical protein
VPPAEGANRKSTTASDVATHAHSANSAAAEMAAATTATAGIGLEGERSNGRDDERCDADAPSHVRQQSE